MNQLTCACHPVRRRFISICGCIWVHMFHLGIIPLARASLSTICFCNSTNKKLFCNTFYFIPVFSSFTSSSKIKDIFLNISIWLFTYTKLNCKNVCSPKTLQSTNIAITKHYSPQTLQSTYIAIHKHCNPQTLQSPNIAIHKHCNPQALQSTNIAIHKQCNPQTLQSTDIAIHKHSTPQTLLH